MKNIKRNTKDIQTGQNRIFLRTPMSIIPPNRIEDVIDYKKRLDYYMEEGNIPAMLHLIIINQMVIWQKLKGK